MKLILKLLFGQIHCHPARFLLTALSIVAASGVVIWVVSGYDALTAQFDDFSDDYLGRYQFVLAQAEIQTGVGAEPEIMLPAEIIQEMSQDESVAELVSESQSRIQMKPLKKRVPPGKRAAAKSDSSPDGKSQSAATRKPDTKGPPGRRGPSFIPPLSPTLVGTNAVNPPYPMKTGRWIEPGSDAREAVISSGSAAAFNVTVGDQVHLQQVNRELDVTIVGIVEQVRSIGGFRGPSPSRGPAQSALYVPVSVAEIVLGKSPPPITISQIRLKETAQPAEFKVRWESRLASQTPRLTLMSTSDITEDISNSRAVSGARSQAWSATGIALLAALFIIFTALSMGVNERTRQFAVLRAVSMTPGQIGLLIGLESLLLGAIGWLGGLAAGWGILKLMQSAQPTLFTQENGLGQWCIILSGICAFGGALAASVFPAWQAMRVSPLEAMSARSTTTGISRGLLTTLTVIGLIMIAINPILIFFWPMQHQSQYAIYAALGYSTMAIGFVLLAPITITIIERVLGSLVARALFLDPRLLSAELSSNLWRTLGTCVALTLGLGLFVSTQIWGYSMLKPFVPGEWVPDLLVNFKEGGIPDNAFQTVAHVDGFRAETCLPLAVEQTKLKEDLTGSKERTSVSRQDSIVLIGVDPERGINAANPLLKLRFVEGDPQTAAEQMKHNRACIIPDHFATEANLTLGDSFEVLLPEDPNKAFRYEVAGIVDLPGWHWMTKLSGLRRRGDRAAAMVFADIDTVRQDFDFKKINFFWTQTEAHASLDDMGNSLQKIAATYSGKAQPTNYQGTWKIGATNFGSAVRISTRQGVQDLIHNRADGMIWGMSQLPLVTLLIAGLGVLNTIMASIRARIWNIGVMRAVGLSRSALARLILAESLLVGLVACCLSLGFGIMAGWCGAGISQYVSFFGGLHPSLVIPWKQIGLGFGITLFLCLTAALWPAFSICRMKLLQLLQSGRSAM
ncbi:ABC transporter permease [Gimesia maris]|uniref:ABC transporter permease n=1 Tax=Gimesia maris TaxID=122 RepID=UPI00241F2562|nr:ABC transporter permease [Gimesia maris]|tara:strand:+ start:32298 stop:35189 length:2892 start_codon:yes stop_codon:yes gene_type:complete